jgi:hypothetical protein
MFAGSGVPGFRSSGVLGSEVLRYDDSVVFAVSS